MSKEFKTLNVQLANTCTLSKLKILVEICIGREEGCSVDYSKKLIPIRAAYI